MTIAVVISPQQARICTTQCHYATGMVWRGCDTIA